MTDNLRERIARAIEISIQNARTAPGSWGFYIPEADAVLAEMRKDAEPVEADNSILGLYRFDTEKDRARAAEALSVQRFRASIAHPPVPPAIVSGESTTSGVDDHGEGDGDAQNGGALRKALKMLTAMRDELRRANEVIRLNRAKDGQGRVTVATAIHRCLVWADEAIATASANTKAGDKDRANPVACPSEEVVKHIAVLRELKRRTPAYMGEVPKAQHYQSQHAAFDAAIAALSTQPDQQDELVEALEAIASVRKRSRMDDAENAVFMQDIAEKALAAYREKRNADR